MSEITVEALKAYDKIDLKKEREKNWFESIIYSEPFYVTRSVQIVDSFKESGVEVLVVNWLGCADKTLDILTTRTELKFAFREFDTAKVTRAYIDDQKELTYVVYDLNTKKGLTDKI